MSPIKEEQKKQTDSLESLRGDGAKYEFYDFT
jgi:hypothetical protein